MMPVLAGNGQRRAIGCCCWNLSRRLRGGATTIERAPRSNARLQSGRRSSKRTSDSDSCPAMRQGRRRGREDFPSSCQARHADQEDCRRDRAGTSKMRADSNTNCGFAKRDNASRDRRAKRLARLRGPADCASSSPVRPLAPAGCCDEARVAHLRARPSCRLRAPRSRRTFGDVSFRFSSRSIPRARASA